jgi:hypothetical protein
VSVKLEVQLAAAQPLACVARGGGKNGREEEETVFSREREEGRVRGKSVSQPTMGRVTGLNAALANVITAFTSQNKIQQDEASKSRWQCAIHAT